MTPHDPAAPTKSDWLTRVLPIAFIATAALWLVLLLITDWPAWPLAVYVALGIAEVQRRARSAAVGQTN